MVSAIVFTETGLFLGFFLPGDSLLVTAGVFCAAGHLNLWVLSTLTPLCAFIGDQVGYWIGHGAGQALYSREDSFFFRRRHLEHAHAFYEKYGGKTIVLARFVPIVRTFAPPVAGAATMRYRRYVSFSILGSVLWVWSMVWAGYLLGSAVPDVNAHIHIVIAVVIVLSLLPGGIEALRQRRKKSQTVFPRAQ
jgi:membrane-associated protein